MHGFWCDQPLHPLHSRPSVYEKPFMEDLFVGEQASCTRRGNQDLLREASVDLWTDIPNRAVL